MVSSQKKEERSMIARKEKCIVISIKHKYAEKIYSGEKTMELRKCCPSVPPGTRCFIYEPLPYGRITGFFDYGGCITSVPENLWNAYSKLMGIEKNEYLNYFKGCKRATGWLVTNVHKFYRQFFLDEYDLARAPQSYCFIKRTLGR